MSEVPPTLLGLVQRYSPTGSEAPAVDWLVVRMKALGFDDAYRDPGGNAVGVKGSGSKQIVLLGHIDTVPGEIPIRCVEGILYGRGSVDAKGPLAAFVDAAAGVEVQADWQIVVIGAVDEEGNSSGTRSICDSYQPVFAIIGEPSQWNRVTLGYKGIQRSRLSCSVQSGHTSLGVSANDLMLEAWQSLLERVKVFNDGRSMFEQIIPTVLCMKSDTDGFQMNASFEVSARLPIDVPPELWMEDWLGKMENIVVESVIEGIPAFRADRNSPLTRAFQGAIRHGGGTPSFVSKSGTADINIVAPVWGCPVLAYGPGDSNLDHTPDEHLHIDEYWQSVSVLQGVFERLGIKIARFNY